MTTSRHRFAHESLPDYNPQTQEQGQQFVTPQDYINKWRDSSLKERAGSQEHFIDLCRVLGEKTPAEADSKGDWYTFE